MTALMPATARQLLARAARAQRESRAPGLVTGVVRDGALAWSTARGDVVEPHTDVQHRLGSITKTLTAVTVLRLRDEGRLALDDPLERHLPGTPAGDRTVGQLLSHTAGLTSESPGQWWERTPGGTLADLGLAPEHVPLGAGRQFHYSNLGYGLLGELVAAVRGRPWVEVVRQEVLLPLGMTRTTPRPEGSAATGWAVHPWADVLHPEPEHFHGAMAPAGQLWAPLADLARLAAFLLGDTGGVLDPGTVEEMTVPAGVDSQVESWSAYGLGLQVQRVRGRTLVGHGGSMPGHLAGVFVDRDRGAGAVVLRNATSGADGGLLGDLLDLLDQHEPAVGPAWRASPAAVDLDLLGAWYWGPAPYVLRLQGDGLLHLGGLDRAGRTSRFRPRGDGTWVGLDGYFTGEVMAVSAQRMVVATFVFTRTPYDPGQELPGGPDERGWR
ncbi:MAG TPA: serine hydrolase domain-containing protein [Mycobacteriales bacterium]|jgi:CubicO group peptidase (beta-lactamase class C family)|nr:serine hydrolase domain-containing protein [Mycobacteriales bacterium]